MTYLNPDEDKYLKHARNKFYVDKTLFIEKIVQRIDEEENSIAYILPRRFGKSSLASMLVSYLSKGADSRNLFSDKKIAQIPNWDENLNKHNVIYIDMQDIGDTVLAVDYFKNLYENVNTDLIKNYPNIKLDINKPFTDNIKIINEETSEKFAFIFDEYDVIFRKEEYADIENEYLKFLNKLVKGGNFSNCVSLVYLTGILPLKLDGSHSGLNNVNTISLIDTDGFDDFIGFTEEEVKAICKDNDIDFNEIKEWYNGYNLESEKSIYNPYAINKFLSKNLKEGKCFWTETSAVEAVKQYILFKEEKIYKNEVGTEIEDRKLELNSKRLKLIKDGLYEEIVLMAKEIKPGEERIKFPATISTQIPSLTDFDLKSEIYNLLIYLGYLTYDYKTQECYIPNKEIAQYFRDKILKGDTPYGYLYKMLTTSEELLKNTIAMDSKYVAENFHVVHEDFSHFNFYGSPGAFQSFISVAYYYAYRDYEVTYEFKSGQGYADAVFTPRYDCKLSKITERPPIIFELKYSEQIEINPSIAIEQIKTKEYFNKLKKEYSRILLVGLVFFRNKKDVFEHKCVIEEYNV